MQVFLFRDDNGNLPDNMIDNWSIGYVAGVVDALLYSKDIENNSSVGMAAMMMAFDEVFGSAELFGKFMGLQSNSETMSAMKTGGDEVMKFIKDSSDTPRGWANHIHNKN